MSIPPNHPWKEVPAIAELVRYAQQCKTCNSPHRAEIERWVTQEGLDYRAASRRLKEQYGEQITGEAISRHMRRHFPVAQAALEVYQAKASEELAQGIVRATVDELGMLETTASRNFELSQATAAWLDDLLKKKVVPPTGLAILHEKLTSEMAKALKLREEILGRDPESRKASALSSWLDLVVRAHADSS